MNVTMGCQEEWTPELSLSQSETLLSEPAGSFQPLKAIVEFIYCADSPYQEQWPRSNMPCLVPMAVYHPVLAFGTRACQSAEMWEYQTAPSSSLACNGSCTTEPGWVFWSGDLFKHISATRQLPDVLLALLLHIVHSEKIHSRWLHQVGGNLRHLVLDSST